MLYIFKRTNFSKINSITKFYETKKFIPNWSSRGPHSKFFLNDRKFYSTNPKLDPDNVKELLSKLSALNFAELITLEKQLLKMTGINPEMISKLMSGVTSTGSTQQAAKTQAAPTATEQPAAASSPAQERLDPRAAAAKAAAAAKQNTRSASVKLIAYPEGNKMNVLREVRKLKPGMNLMDSKKLVENLPQILQKDVTANDQKEWKDALEAAGAKIEFIYN